jgi:hypothetical protein
MLKILDMPKGGGADHGQNVWFSLITEDGQEHVFKIDRQRLGPLLQGLEHFADQAKALRLANGIPDVPEPPPVAEKVRSRRLADGGLEVGIGLKGRGVVEFSVPRPAIKALLDALEAGLDGPTGRR